MSLSFTRVVNTAFAVGVIGDLMLNVLTQSVLKGDPWGLKTYFPKHGTVEATMIAGGLMFVTMFAGLILWGNDPNKKNTALFLFVFGSLVDFILFRKMNIMPSLKGMYEAMSAPLTMFWAGGPLVFSLWLAQNI